MSRRDLSRLINGPTLMLACLALYLPLFWQLPLTRAEAMYALIPKEMLGSGSWLTPFLNGAPYLDKPQLLYWLNLAVYKILGVSDWAARIPTLILAMGEVWVTFLIGRRLLGKEAAWLGGGVLLSSIGFFILHLQLLTDHLITLALAGSLYFLLRWQEERSFRWAALFHLSLVAGFLAKGVIGLGFPVLIALLYALQLRQSRLFSLLFSPKGLTLVLLFLAPWFVGVEQANPGFLKFQIINEQVLRFLGQRQPQDVNSFSVYAFWLFLGIWLLPWTVLLPEALWRFWRETGPQADGLRKGRLLLIWAAVILVFFSLSSSRIEYYTLPAFPPLALILGWRLKRYLDSPRDYKLLWGFLMISILSLGIFLLLPHLEQICVGNRREYAGMCNLIDPVARPLTFLMPMLALLGGLAGWRRPRATVACFSALALVLVFFSFQSLMALTPHLSDKLPGDYLRAQAAPQDVVIMEYIEEFEYGASLAFYSGRRILMVQRDGLPQFPYRVSPPEDYLISPERLLELWEGPDRVFLLVDDAMPTEPCLEKAMVAFQTPGKRLLVNRP
jgi:hypothetical protein